MALASLAADNVVAHGVGYAASSAGLLLTLALWIAGSAVGEGVRADGLRNAAAGPDIVVSARALGRHAPLEVEFAQRLRALNGVEKVEGRIVGTVDTASSPILLVGVEPERFARALELVQPLATRTAGGCLVGAELAHELGLAPGVHLSLDGVRTQVVSISGVLQQSDALAGSKALVMELSEAQALFGDTRLSDLCVWTRAGYAEAVARACERLAPGIEASTREATCAAIEHAANRRSGGWSALLAPLLALATASFAALCWFAHGRRGTEIAAYKLSGFSAGDILFVAMIENALVAFAIGCTAFLSAWIFVRVCNAPLLAAYLVPDLDLFSTQRVPASFTPLPLGLGFALAFSSTLAGSILATWRLSLERAAKAFA